MNEDEKKRLEEELALANQGKGSSGNPNSEPVGLSRIVTEKPQPTAVTPVTFNYSDYVDSLEPPISKEEQAKRERASKAVHSVGALGNLMSAFANLTYTGKGAPSQTIPTQYVENLGKERETWREKLKSEREKYAAADLSARVQDYQLREQRRKEQEDLNRRAEDVAWRQSEAERNQRNADRERTDRLAQQEEENRLRERQIGVSERNANTSALNAATQAKRADSYAEYNDWKISGGGSSSNWNKPITTRDEKGNEHTAIINAKALNPSNLQQILETLPEETRRKYGLSGDYNDASVKGAFDEKVSRAIGEAARSMESETYQLMERLGLISAGDSIPSLKDAVGVSTENGTLGWGLETTEKIDNKTDW